MDSTVPWPHPLARGVARRAQVANLMAPFAAWPGGLLHRTRLIEPRQGGVVSRQMRIIIDSAAADGRVRRGPAALAGLTLADQSGQVLLPRTLEPAVPADRSPFVPAPHQEDQHNQAEHERVPGYPHHCAAEVQILNRGWCPRGPRAGRYTMRARAAIAEYEPSKSIDGHDEHQDHEPHRVGQPPPDRFLAQDRQEE